jgi:hypothetical protein
MAAAYPAAAPTFTPIVDGVDYPQAAQINAVYDEVAAIGTALVSGGLAHDLDPDATAGNRDLGSSAKKWRNLYLTGSVIGATWAQVCEGRLTLTSGLPATVSDVTAAGTLYFTPYKGNRISLYDGTQWSITTFAEVSVTFTATSGKNYDVYVFLNAGVVTLEIVEWTNDTTRATAIAFQDGVPVKTGTLTKRLVATVRASGSNVAEDSAAKRFVSNVYNPLPVPLVRKETANTWTGANGGWGQANVAAANKVELVNWFAERSVQLALNATGVNATAQQIAAAIGENSTSAVATNCVFSQYANSVRGAVAASLNTVPAAGYSYYAWLEYSNSGTTTWIGDDGTAFVQSGLIGQWWH